MTSTKDEDEFDPYAVRTVEKPMTDLDAFISLLKCSVGTGIIAMPLAISYSGWLLGLIGLFVVGLIEIGGIHLLIYCMVLMCKRRKVSYMTFREAVEASFEEGPKCLKCLSSLSKFLVDFFLIFYQLGICTIYVVFVASSVKEVCDSYMELDLRVHIILLSIPCILILLIRHMKYLVPFSCLANCFIFIGLSVIFYYIFTGLPEFDTMQPVGTLHQFPIFIGTVLFAVGAVGVMIAIEENMANPKDYLGWTGVLLLGGIFITSVYAVFGFFGYWRFGSDAEANIALNLPRNKVGSILNVLFAFSIFFSYPLQCYVAIEIIWHQCMKKHFNENVQLFWEYLTRVLIAIFTVFVAVIFPNLGAFITLIGAFCTSILGLIFPGLMHICILYSTSYGPLKYYLIQNILLIIFGIFAGIFGTYVAVEDMIAMYL